jgi:hypothetical protein
MVTLRLLYAPVNLTIFNFFHLLQLLQTLPFEAIVNKFDTFIVIYDQFKFVSDASSNIRKVTR